jgi:hypothetical protein
MAMQYKGQNSHKLVFYLISYGYIKIWNKRYAALENNFPNIMKNFA